MALGVCHFRPRERALTAHRMRTSGELQLTRMPQQGSCRCTTSPSIVFRYSFIEARRCLRPQVRMEAAKL